MIKYYDNNFFGRRFEIPEECDDCFCDILDLYDELKDEHGDVKLEFTTKDIHNKKYHGAITDILYGDGTFTLKRMGLMYCVFDSDESMLLENACPSMLFAVYVKLNEIKKERKRKK